MPKFAVYQGLMARNDWAAERQGRAMNLQAMAQLEQRAKAKTQEQLESQAMIGKLFKDLENMPVNPEDVERVQAAELEQRKGVIQGIKKYNGDLNAYIKSGGQLAIDNYKTNVMENKDVQQAMANKTNLGLAIKAMQDDKYLKNVTVKIPGEDEEGNPIYTNKQMSFNKAYAMYKSGEITELPYFGEEDKVKVSAFDFKDDYKDADNPFGDNTVTESDVYDVAIMEGASPEQARDLANTYGRGAMESGNTWNWGSSRMVQDKLAYASLAQRKKEFNFKKSQSGGSSRTLLTDPAINQYKSMQVGQEVPLDFKQREAWMKQFGGKQDENGNVTFGRTTMAMDESNTDVSHDLSKAHHTYPIKMVRNIGKDGKPYTGLLVEATYEDKGNFYSTEEGTPLNSDFFFTGPDEEVRHGWSENSDGSWTGYGIVPVDKYLNDQVFHQTFSDFMGLDTRSTFVAPHGYNQGYMEKAINVLSDHNDLVNKYYND